MEHKTALDILVKLLDKHSFEDDEREAVLTAIGVLSWTKLAHSRMKNKTTARRDAPRDSALNRTRTF